MEIIQVGGKNNPTEVVLLVMENLVRGCHLPIVSDLASGSPVALRQWVITLL